MTQVGHVPESLIQEILARVEISELVGRYVKLKKAGRDYSGLCPFHHEKTPSFTVSPKKQFYHCFGCGKHGDAIAFLMEHQGVSFIDAVGSLAESVGVELPKSNYASPQQKSLQPIHEVLKQAAIFFHQQWKTPKAKDAIAYLKERGLTKEVVNQFAVGYAPEGWENLSNYLKKKGYDEALMIEAGLANEGKRNGVYDRFRNRIMFPIRDIKGRVLGFGGRAQGDETPKYLNSPQTPVFHKSECLYGLFEAKHRGSRVVLVEGYMDVIALAQYDVCALATLGTAVTQNHLKHLFRYFDHVVYCFDGDNAGQSAAWKACVEALPLKTDSRQIDFILMPQGQDPDTYIRAQGESAFRQLLDNATPFSDYFFKRLTDDCPPTTLDNRARLVKRGLPLLNKLPEGVFRSMMFDRLNNWKYEGSTPYKPRRSTNLSRGKLQKALTPSEWLSIILLKYPEWLAMIDDPENLVSDATGAPLFREVVHQIVANPDLDVEQRKAILAKKNVQWSRILSSTPWNLLSEEALEEEFLGAIARLNAQNERKIRENLLEKAKNGELSDLEKKTLKKFYEKGN